MSTRVSVTIPLDRMGVLIGKDGSVKSKIEDAFKTNLLVQSQGGVVEIVPRTDSEDPTTILRARDVVLAIGRGFAQSARLNSSMTTSCSM